MQARLDALAEAELCDEQLHIFQTIAFEPGTAVCASAGAGAGKTTVLKFLVVKALLEPSVTEVRIMTATRVAKNEAYDRVAAFAVDGGFATAAVRHLRPADVSTFHAEALRFTRSSATHEDDDRPPVEVVHAGRVRLVMERALAEANKKVDVDDASNICDHYRMESSEAAKLLCEVRSERLHACVPAADASFGPTALHALRRFEEMMQHDEESGARLVDFDAMVDALRLSKQSVIAPAGVLFVDEGQDLTLAQLEIVYTAVKQGACVVMLGDDSQGIFVFSGACTRTLQSFRAYAEGKNIPLANFYLNVNHRSTSLIVAVAEAMLPAGDRAARTNIRGNGRAGPPVMALCASEECNVDGMIAEEIVTLVEKKLHAPGEIVVLRHKNWGFGDSLVSAVRQAADRRNVPIPFCVSGGHATDTVVGRFVSLSAVFSPNEPLEFDGVRAFLRSLKGHHGAPELSMKAIQAVVEGDACTDALGVFARRPDQLVAKFKELHAADQARQKPQAAQAKNPAKKQRVDRKLENFKALVATASKAVALLRSRAADVEKGDAPASITLAPQPCPFAMPEATTPLGKLVVSIVRDVLNPPASNASDHASVRKIISICDQELMDGEAVADGLAIPIATLEASVSNKEAETSVRFSTIHRFKGREAPCAFVVDLKEPWAKIDWARRAALSGRHDGTCTNKSGLKPACCRPFGQALRELELASEAETRRLHYVAASRAKHRLFLVTSKRGGQRAYHAATDQLVQRANGGRRVEDQWVAL